MSKRKIIAINGSARKDSTNHRLIKAITSIAGEQLSITLSTNIASLPQFNPDDDTTMESAPEPVQRFRQQLREADGILICTPEYAHGVPGALKNAIDWTVSSCEFSHKPTLLITASTEGQYGHKALLETLHVIEAKDVERLNLLIPFVKTKINSDNTITDEKTLTGIKNVLSEFVNILST